VLLKVDDCQRDYLRTLPLHASQREIETQEEYSVFELYVALTIELTMQILYYGSRVEVLEPAELREEIEEEAYRLYEVYSKDNNRDTYRCATMRKMVTKNILS
jgi:hypothetical protein